jgi:peptidyl-Lys metalloendopeptidase
MPKSLQKADPAELVFSLTNAGSEVVQVLNWQTPFEGIKAPMFDITRDGAEVEYRGRMLKRGAPKKDDYFVLKPGERKQARIDLAGGWDVSAPGTYTVTYTAELFDVIAGSGSAPRGVDDMEGLALDCNSVTFVRAR